ncbi:MAG TPA: metalloregulator ArsR/SmtB family transcription factor [Candidatus Omnitrophota bacterium]|nr:metalloregulator ArsR/SmtB family transcription factor [Candidatus Omnitrophota bacterium]
MMDYQKESDILKALAHPMRLRMVEGLIKDHCNVTKIVEKTGLPQSTISQHLGILKKAGILTPEKKGVETCYHVTHDKVKKIIHMLNA